MAVFAGELLARLYFRHFRLLPAEHAGQAGAAEARFTSTEVVYGVTGTGVTELPGTACRREERRPPRDPSKWFQSNEGE